MTEAIKAAAGQLAAAQLEAEQAATALNTGTAAVDQVRGQVHRQNIVVARPPRKRRRQSDGMGTSAGISVSA